MHQRSCGSINAFNKTICCTTDHRFFLNHDQSYVTSDMLQFQQGPKQGLI